MTDSLLIPSEFYFQSTFEIPFQEKLEKTILSGKHPSFPVSLPNLKFESPETKPFGTVSLAWNDSGLAVSAQIAKEELKENASDLVIKRVANRPFIEFFIDTRDMKTNKRANRFCHHFSLSIPSMKQKKKNPVPELMQQDMVRSRGKSQLLSPDKALVVGTVQTAACRSSCWLPRKILEGYDPENVPSIGFFYKIFDARFGEQLYGLGDKFPYTSDPSLWPSLKLKR